MSAFFEGLFFGGVLAILVGPILFALIQTGIEQGFRAGMTIALGVFVSDLLFVVAVYFGLTYILALVKLDGFNLTLGIVGGIALILIGIGTLLSKPPNLPEDDSFLENKILDQNTGELKKTKTPYYSLFAKGFFVNTLNPFTFFFWGVIATAKMAESNFSQDEFFFFFSGILLVIVTTDTLKVYLAKKIRKYLKRKNILMVRTISGVAFVIFGVVLMIRVMFE